MLAPTPNPTPGEIATLGVLVVAAFALVLATTRGLRRELLAFGGLFALVTSVSAAVLRPGLRSEAPPPAERPGPSTTLGYVSSRACLGCHPGEHASFSRTYHRTMTQLATADVIRAPLDGRAVPVDGRTARLERRGQEVWATLPDPDAILAGTREARGVTPDEASPRVVPDVTRRVVLTTGSHREQAFWVAGARAGDLRLVPFVWLVKDAAFVPRSEAFLTPPDEPLPGVRWASSCIACHAVAGEPRHDLERDVFDTRVAELGITCEACHGPGAAHVERHRDPVARYQQRGSKLPDPTIIHPGKLSPERSAAVCGQCHAYAFPRDEAGWWTDGYSRTFRAGDALEPSRTLLSRAGMSGTGANGIVEHAPVIDAPASAIFWPDGGVRVGGREYNGLVTSPCYQRGAGERKMTCLSCHAMHEGDPAGQIAPARAGDRGCTTCHSGARWEAHSHHASGSPGSACVSCHMPKTSYALLSAVRSHRIDSPSAASSLETGKPNACNLCHLDRTLAWTAERLSEWYGAPRVVVTGDRATTAAGLFDGIAGDAGVRALIADAFGSAEAIAAPAFRAAILGEMQRDPYAAVRFIAARSARVASPLPRAPGSSAGVLALTVDGQLDPTRLRALLAARDERRVTIAE